MPQTFRIGPSRLLAADSFSDPISEWTDLGHSRGDTTATVSAAGISRGKTDQDGAAPIANAIHLSPGIGRVTYSATDQDALKLVQSLPGAVRVTSGTKQALTLGHLPATYSTKAVALVPELTLTDRDNPNPFESSSVVYFEKAIISISELPAGSEVSDSDDALHRFQIEISAVQGQSGWGYPYLNANLTNPVGILYSWQPALDGSTAAIGTGEIAALATFPADGITILVQLSDAGASGTARIGDASLSATEYSLAVDSSASWVRANGTLYTQSGLGGVAETILQVAADGTVNGWDDSTQDISAASTEDLSALTLNSSGDDVTVTYDEADVTAIIIVAGTLTPAQIRSYIRT